MGIFGWDLPPGVSAYMIDRMYGDDPPCRCVICGRFLSIENESGACLEPRGCGAELAKRQKLADDALAAEYGVNDD